MPPSRSRPKVVVYTGEGLARYSFGDTHPFGPQRHSAFVNEFRAQGLDKQVSLFPPVIAEQSDIELFHTHEYVEFVKEKSVTGDGLLDYADTPAFPGVYEAAATVVGTTINALEKINSGQCKRAFSPIAGLHHARRDTASGFCVFNDCGVAIEVLRQRFGIQRIAYVDIDAHHGDGVFYAFEEDPDLIFIDLHEDGRYLYPGTGAVNETGKGLATGTKLNIPMPPGADDEQFLPVWATVENFLQKFEPEFILFQCGADSLEGDPITHLAYTEATHRHAAASLCKTADRYCEGKLLAMGGGGYNLDNLAKAWNAVIETFIQA